MRIGISASASDGGQSGISTYMRHIVGWLPRVGPEHEFELIADEDDLGFLGPAAAVSVVPLPRKLRNPLRNILWHQLELPLIARRRRYDVMFFLAGNRRLPGAAPCVTVGTVHDMASFHVAGKYDRWRDAYVRRVLPWLIRRLSRVITVSRASRDDIVESCAVPSERVTVIHNGVDTARFSPGDAGAARAALAGLGLRAPYFLFVSRIEHPGKNHVRLIDAFASLKARGVPHQLVLAGADRERAAEVHEAAAASGCAADIRFQGFVPDDALVPLYRAATALVFPSLYEGFGLPVLEAMACGVPVLCSAVSSLPEVAGEAALYFDPHSTGSLAGAMLNVIGSEPLAAALSGRSLRRAAEFTMEATARQTLRVLEQAHAARVR